MISFEKYAEIEFHERGESGETLQIGTLKALNF